MKNKKSVVFSILLCLVLPLLLMNCDPNVESGTFRIIGYAMNSECYTAQPWKLEDPEEPNLESYWTGTMGQADCPFYVIVANYLAPDEDIDVTGGSQGKMVVKKIEATYHVRTDIGWIFKVVNYTAKQVEPGEMASILFPILGGRELDLLSSPPYNIDVIFEVSAEYAGVTYTDSKGFTIYLR